MLDSTQAIRTTQQAALAENQRGFVKLCDKKRTFKSINQSGTNFQLGLNTLMYLMGYEIWYIQRGMLLFKLLLSIWS